MTRTPKKPSQAPRRSPRKDPTPDLFDDRSAASGNERPEGVGRAGEPASAEATDADAELDVEVEETLAELDRVPAQPAPPTAGASATEGSAAAAGSGAPPPRRPLGLEPIPTDGESVPLAVFASRAYLDYAMSVLKGRALPDVADGQKPVQRRILYVMQELGLAPNAKPMKSARVVGDVLGKYHPHGDSAAYDAMVRMAQDFSLRYPLVDGHGNYGSRDGDAAAAYRYTEARLTAFASHVLLSEIGLGTVEFVANYDGAFREPQLLPARLPVVLLNGASGIAVGMATEIPSHNLNEVAQAAIAVIRAKGKKPPTVDELLALMPGPDFPGGGQIISAPEDVADAYRTGRGTVRVRARWTFEELARGQWQAVITELPHGVSTARVLSEIEEISNPKVRPGKKSVTPEQTQQKALLLGVLDRVRDESDKDHPVRLVIEPRTSKIDRAELANTLLALTSLETTASINLVMIGRDGRPRQKDLASILDEWADFRIATVERRCRHRMAQVDDRLHVLEGRLVVHLNVDKVIRTIREADDPKAALIAKFRLSERQAEDILEMRLRQLARLESIRIEQEIEELKGERAELEDLLTNPASLRRLVVKEIEADAKRFGDRRRTLIRYEGTASRAQVVLDEPVTVLVSERGWLKARVGHGLDPVTFTFKEGDALRAAYEVRTVDSVAALSTDGRAYTIAVSSLPGGKSDGAPASSFVELSPGAKVAHVFVGAPEQRVLLGTSGGYGFVCQVKDLASRVRAGKQFMSVEEGETVLAPALVADGAGEASGMTPGQKRPETAPLVVAVSAAGKVLAFALDEMRTLAGGGRGVQTLVPDPRDAVAGICATHTGVVIEGSGRGGKPSELALSAKDLAPFEGHRARKGRLLPYRIKPTGIRAAGAR